MGCLNIQPMIRYAKTYFVLIFTKKARLIFIFLDTVHCAGVADVYFRRKSS